VAKASAAYITIADSGWYMPWQGQCNAYDVDATFVALPKVAKANTAPATVLGSFVVS
jgi:hypothetical protein